VAPMTPADIDIVTKPGRAWASLHANSKDGRSFIMKSLPAAESCVTATFPASFVGEHARNIEAAGLMVRVWEFARPVCPPTDRNLGTGIAAPSRRADVPKPSDPLGGRNKGR
jgi:hypothetical protein